MRRGWFVSTVAAGVGVWLSATAAVQGAKPTNDTPLSVGISNTDGYGAKADFDTLTYDNGYENVRAVLVQNDFGNFVFDTNDNSRQDGGRRVLLNFGGQAGDLAGLPSNGWFAADVFIGTLGVTGDPAVDGNLRTMAAGTDLPRRTRLGFTRSGVNYSLRWDATAEDGVLNFHCDLAASDGCLQWTVTPRVYSTGMKAGLYTVTVAKGSSTDTYHGSYTMPFTMTLVRR